MAALTVVGATATSDVHAANDSKSISPTQCQPVGPGTTIGELIVNSYGVFNPGITNETVICPLMTDADSPWSATPAASGQIAVRYRAGAVSGKVACTLYSGSTVTSALATYAATFNPAMQPAGTRSIYGMALAEVSGGYDVAPQLNLVCTISPKAALGTIFLVETVATSIP